ncbi:MAG: uL15 family ribosomal protein [Methanomassiliicoccales archaeon]
MVSRTNKFRGSRTHGRGKKSGRGAGIHGGRGNAGLHKHKYMHTLKYDPLHFGVHGFKRPQKMLEERRGISLHALVESLDALEERGLAKREADAISVDLEDMGYYKLVGSAHVTSKLNISAGSVSERAKKCIEAAGGSVTLK